MFDNLYYVGYKINPRAQATVDYGSGMMDIDDAIKIAVTRSRAEQAITCVISHARAQWDQPAEYVFNRGKVMHGSSFKLYSEDGLLIGEGSDLNTLINKAKNLKIYDVVLAMNDMRVSNMKIKE